MARSPVDLVLPKSLISRINLSLINCLPVPQTIKISSDTLRLSKPRLLGVFN